MTAKALTGFLAMCLLVLSAFGPDIAAAQTAAPAGPVILTVSGKLANTNGDGRLRFDLAMLKKLPQTSFKTKTIWTQGEHTFTGVSLKDLFAAAGAGPKSAVIHATALNDYSVKLPFSDAVQGGPIVAYLMDGAEMSVREKGPLWVVYPFDSNPDYRTEVVYSRAIWQLSKLDVQE